MPGLLRHRMRGLAVVEATIVLPVFLVLLLGVAEVGRMLFQYNALTKSVRDAAREVAGAALSTSTTGVIDLTPALIARARNLAVYGSPAAGRALLPGYAPGQVAVTVLDSEHIAVTATFSYVPMFAVLPTFGFGQGGLDLSGNLIATCRMRAL